VRDCLERCKHVVVVVCEIFYLIEYFVFVEKDSQFMLIDLIDVCFCGKGEYSTPESAPAAFAAS
jgi:hypothetical protein